jgi:hypothetical protein
MKNFLTVAFLIIGESSKENPNKYLLGGSTKCGVRIIAVFKKNAPKMKIDVLIHK